MAALVRRREPKKLTSIAFFQSSTSLSSSLVSRGPEAKALATTASTPPKAASLAAMSARQSSSLVTSARWAITDDPG